MQTHGMSLSMLTMTPVAGAVLVWILGGTAGVAGRGLGFAFALASLVQAVVITAGFDVSIAGFQSVERHAWIPSIGAEYHLGLDGLNVLMILLAALLVPMAMAVGHRGAERSNSFWALLLLLQAGLFGVFTALNFFHWFLFWELSLIPAYFLIKLWGGLRRRSAATVFFLYTLVGSVAMLLAMQVVYLAVGTLDFGRLGALAASGDLGRGLERLGASVGMSGHTLGLVLFAGVFLGLAVKVPVVPFHTWLPATYSEAPAAVTMVLTGAMSKMGLYGILRILVPVFPAQMLDCIGWIWWMALLTVVASAYAACVQTDLRRVLAYSSMNHLGFCLLGVCAAAQAAGDPEIAIRAQAAALAGVLFQMFNHGITASALFGFAEFLDRRTGGPQPLQALGGLRKPAPVLAGLMGIALFASLGLPGLNGFVGEFLILRGAFVSNPIVASAATAGLLATAVFLLTLIQRVFTGPERPEWRSFRDLSPGEIAVMAPPTFLMFTLGLVPGTALAFVNPTVTTWIRHLYASL